MTKSPFSMAAVGAWALLFALLMPPPAWAAISNTLVTAAVSTGSAPGTTDITPLDVKTTTLSSASNADTVVLGPQSLLLRLVNAYPNSYVLDITVNLTNATFASVDSILYYSLDSAGALKLVPTSGCNKIVNDAILTIADCRAAATPSTNELAVIVLSGVTYKNAAQLATAGTSIKMTVRVANDSGGATIEQGGPTNVVTSSAPATYLLNTTTAGIGSGTIDRSSAGPNYTPDTVVTLTATPATGSVFTGWSGACSGTSTCQVTMTAEKSATATFSPILHMGPILSTKDTTSQSFLRFYNSGATAGTVTVDLINPGDGTTLAHWTSPEIAAGASIQYSVGAMEAAATAAFTKPTSYSAVITPKFQGAVQHVIWNTAQGTLTNQSACDSPDRATGKQLINVHSSKVSGYPSSVVVTNTGAAGQAVLTITNGDSGATLGTYTTSSVASTGQATVTVAQIEAATTALSPAPTTYYGIGVPSSYSGYLQHSVANTQSSVVTDMTEVCPF